MARTGPHPSLEQRDLDKYSNLADVERSIKRAKAQGLQVCSISIIRMIGRTPPNRLFPLAWASIKDDNALAQTLYQYTFDTLTTLNQDGLMPDIVQVGNEINSEILLPAPLPKGQTTNWTRNAKLLNAAIKAVRDAGAKSSIHPKVMLHIAQPENVEPWLKAATAAGVTDFDLIGISYYPKWSRKTLAGLGAVINSLRRRYPNAEVVVAETAYPWTLSWADSMNNQMGQDDLMSPYRATPEGQDNI